MKLYDQLKKVAENEELKKLGGKNDFTEEEVETALLKFLILERLPLYKIDSKPLKALMKGTSSYYIHKS